MRARRDEAGDVGHVDEKRRSVVVSDPGEALEVDHAGVGAGTRYDQRGVVLLGLRGDVVVVDALRLGVEPVRDDLVQPAGVVCLGAVREVAAVGEVHAHDGVAGLGEHGLGRVVGLRARVRLHVGELAAKQALHALDGQALDLVDRPAAAVVAPAGKSLGILVGERRADGLHHGGRDEVLGRDELDGVALALELVVHAGRDLGVFLPQVLKVHAGLPPRLVVVRLRVP